MLDQPKHKHEGDNLCALHTRCLIWDENAEREEGGSEELNDRFGDEARQTWYRKDPAQIDGYGNEHQAS